MDASPQDRRVVLVTGVNNPEGIGAAVARAFGRRGDLVFATGLPVPSGPIVPDLPPGRKRYEALQAVPVEVTANEIVEAGGVVAAVAADLADPDAVPGLFGEAERRLGPVAVLVHSAAHCSPDAFFAQEGAPAVTEGSHDDHFAVNARSTALLIREFANRFRHHGLADGRIVSVSTDAAKGHAGQVSYGASKHALESYSRAAAWELGPLGITVNVVAPGPVQTGWIDAGTQRSLVERLPLGRLGKPEDVADLCIFLASERAGWITGQVLVVNGGQRMP